MQHALARPLPKVNWWLSAFVIANLFLGLLSLNYFAHGDDWRAIARAASLAGEPELYAIDGTFTPFVWSPLAAYAVAPLVPLGLEGLRVLLVASALAMPSWTLRIVVLTSWMFWTDVTTGNLLTPIFLSAVWAWRGSRIGTAAFLAGALLIPRPLLVPMGLWLLWKRPEWRIPFAVMLAVAIALNLATGQVDDWVRTVIAVGPGLQSFAFNLSPTHMIGWWWMLAGVPLAAWLTWRGHVGWAGLAISNYVWIYYLYWALPDINRPAPGASSAAPSTVWVANPKDPA